MHVKKKNWIFLDRPINRELTTNKVNERFGPGVEARALARNNNAGAGLYETKGDNCRPFATIKN